MAESPARPAGASRIWAGGICAAAMVTLVALMARAGDPPGTRIADDPTLWWYVARASGLLAWVLLSVSVMGGLLMSTQLTRGRSRQWTQGLHEFLGTLAVVFTVIHLAAVLATTDLGIGVPQLLIPFSRPDNPVAQGFGVLAGYLLAAVMLTSWARAVLRWRWWRRVHLLVFPLWGLAGGHAVLAGSDTTQPLVHWSGLVVGAAILFLVVVRLLIGRPAAPADSIATVVNPDAGLAATPRVVDPQPGPRAETSGGVETGMRLLIGQTTWEADDVVSLRLHAPDGAPLPGWQPGAHIELALASGRCRRYSLCGDPADTRSYRIAVLQVSPGRGGSMEVHNAARAGQLITVHGPRNHFPLVASAAYLFIAGGIGITAMMAMAARVARTGDQWKLVYTGRRRASMAFLDEVRALGPDRVDARPADEFGRPDLGAIIGAASPGTAVYCCGPDRLLDAVRELVAARPDLSVHCERFTGLTGSGGAAFHVELRRTGRIIEVPTDRTLLQAIRDVLPSVRAGCEQGVCGACRTTVLAGEPDHRDELLSSAQRAAGAMLICVSRARSERLTLDL
ncbi:MAG: 2Fe-2S iron-sulfur cluster-binding protein [Pseudonocardiaceae bacterium]